MDTPEDVTDTKIVQSILAHRLRLSLKATTHAMKAAWNDLPSNEKKRYQQMAEQAVMEEEKV